MKKVRKRKRQTEGDEKEDDQCLEKVIADELDKQRQQNQGKRQRKRIVSVYNPKFPKRKRLENCGRKLDGFAILDHCRVDDPTLISHLDMSDGNFVACEVPDFAYFTRLKTLILNENNIHLEDVLNFPNVNTVELNCNGICDIHLVPHLVPSIARLGLSFNDIHTHQALTRLSIMFKHTLVELDLESNQITSLCQDFVQFRCLKKLNLKNNHLSNEYDWYILSQIPMLTDLNLSGNRFRQIPKPRQKVSMRLQLSPDQLQEHQAAEEYHQSNQCELSETVSELQAITMRETIDESTISNRRSNRDAGYQTAPYFPKLCFIDISYNQINDEKEILHLKCAQMLYAIDCRQNPFLKQIFANIKKEAKQRQFQSSAFYKLQLNDTIEGKVKLRYDSKMKHKDLQPKPCDFGLIYSELVLQNGTHVLVDNTNGDKVYELKPHRQVANGSTKSSPSNASMTSDAQSQRKEKKDTVENVQLNLDISRLLSKDMMKTLTVSHKFQQNMSKLRVLLSQ